MNSILIYVSIPIVFIFGMIIGKEYGEMKALKYCINKLREANNEPLCD